MLDEEAELLPRAPAAQQDERQIELLGTAVRDGSQGFFGRYALLAMRRRRSRSGLLWACTRRTVR
jgi:hypothetical protein